MNTTKNRLLQQLLLNKKAKKVNGFTMIELMIGVAIVGTLSAVALPQLTKAQNTAKASAARTTAINTAKTCSIAIIAGTPTDGNVDDADYTGDVRAVADVTCAPSTTGQGATTTSFAFIGGEQTWKVDLDENGIGKNAIKVI
jgi:prepilin-type N-terminal cleavage/methylation domain-containing protein